MGRNRSPSFSPMPTRITIVSSATTLRRRPRKSMMRRWVFTEEGSFGGVERDP